MIVNNIVINIARFVLCLFSLEIFLGILWSGGARHYFAYFLCIFLIIVFFYGVYASGLKKEQRNLNIEKIIFLFGLAMFVLSGFYNFLGLANITGTIFQLIMFIVFVAVFKLRKLN